MTSSKNSKHKTKPLENDHSTDENTVKNGFNKDEDCQLEPNRDFDIILYGATGYTGELIAEYLLKHYGANGAEDPIRWAIAGRNKTKLELLQRRLEILTTGDNEKVSEGIEIIIADSENYEQLQELTSRTKVVISTVGPYLRYGFSLIRACMKSRTHYVDLCGELPFIKKSMEAFSDEAKEKRLRIVHSCGFDALPSDIGTMILQAFVIAEFGEPADEIEMIVEKTSAKVSSGTIASCSNLFEWIEKDPARMRFLTDTYILNDEKDGLPDIQDRRRPFYDPITGWWIGPFLMGSFNTRIVRKTNELVEYRYGKSFRYNEGIKAPKLIPNFIRDRISHRSIWPNLKQVAGTISAGLITIGVGGLTHMMLHTPTRDIIRNLHSIMVGNPSSKDRERGQMQLLFSARKLSTNQCGTENAGDTEREETKEDPKKKDPQNTGAANNQKGNQELARTTIYSNLDPAYGGSAVMIAEAALAIALELDQLPGDGGVLTPAAALGERIASRLEKTGHFQFHTSKTES